MYFEKIANQVKRVESGDFNDWDKLRQDIINTHNDAATINEYIELLDYYARLMNKVEDQIIDIVDLEKFKQARYQEYNMLLIRECTIGGSICVESLYDITQRELEYGRMLPTHEYIDMAIEAMALPHYSKERLQFQEQRNIEKNKTPGIFKRIFNQK